MRTALRVALLLATGASGAAAQDEEPIGRYVIDLRGAFVRLNQSGELAEPRGLRADQLPPRGIAVDLGGHFYLFRWKAVTFGVGASVVSTSAHRPPTAPAPEAPVPDELVPPAAGPVVTTRFTAVSPQISFNFGHRNGWSYLGGGLGTSRLNVYPRQATTPPQRRGRTLNYGGGARWFLTPSVALSLDLRFFAISPLEQLGEQPGSPRMTLTAANVGVSIR